jgi:AbrB family looped-hinge helix DNA binding protein
MTLTDGICHPIIPFMGTIVTVDGAGRVVIPKQLRDELGLAPGDTLSLETDGERVTLSPVRATSAMRKEDGVWVFRGESSVSAADTDKTLDSLRRSRDRFARG